MTEPAKISEIDEGDLQSAIGSLNSASFARRFTRTDCNAANPAWKTPSGQSLKEYVRDQMDGFRKDLGDLKSQQFKHRVFQRSEPKILFTVAHNQLFQPFVPAAGDLFHIYAPDGNKNRDWRRDYRYAWKEEGPNAIIYSNDAGIIEQGKLACNSYCYSGQSSYAIVGAGMFFVPQSQPLAVVGSAKLSIRPYVQWLTSASFTGTRHERATVSAGLGIRVDSREANGTLPNVDIDQWITVYSQNTQSYVVNAAAGGAASGGDGLSAEILAVNHRKYYIFVYAWLETSADPQPEQSNEQRFVTIDIDATVPFVVIEETIA
jgi:hypothetical protein